MSTFSKRIKINTDVLLEYVYDDSNFKSDDYKVLTNLKETTKSYLSTTGLNTEDNNLFMVDDVLDKYAKVDKTNFNFLRLQNYTTTLTPYDTVKLYFPSGFDFYNDYIGFYINVFAHGYDNNTKYSMSNFFYTKDNTDSIRIFDLPRPFLFDSKYWVRSVEFDIPSLFNISNQRIITNTINEPTPNSMNQVLSYGEGLSTNSPIFIDFGFISSKNSVLGVDYYYMGDLASFSIPQSPEYNEVGVVVQESTQGDYFEFYGTYMGSNENMDEFAYNEEVKGEKIELEYVVHLYEENILTTNQTFEVTENFTQKILYRPIIKFSNTTAAIDVEMRIVNRVDGSYTSKYGSVGITNSINKYGRTLTRLNMDEGVVNSEILNVKFKNIMQGNILGGDNVLDLVKVPYPVMIDKYRILTKSSNASPGTNDYVPNGLLEIVLTSFDTIVNFNVAQDINSEGEPMPYNLSELNNNSKILLTFKSDTEKVEKEIYYEADNAFEIGNIYYKIEENDYITIRNMYEKGYDNFYLIVNSENSNTQLYSGKYVFYEDLSFVTEDDTTNDGTTDGTVETSGTTLDNAAVTETIVTTDQETVNTETIDEPTYKAEKVTKENNPFNPENMPAYTQNPKTDKNYFNVMIYIRFQTNMDKLDDWLEKEGITPKINYQNVYFLERIYKTKVQEIKKLNYVEEVFDLKITLGQAPKEVKKISTLDQVEHKAREVYRLPVPKKTHPIKHKPYTPPKPNIVLKRVVSDKVIHKRKRQVEDFEKIETGIKKKKLDNKFTKTSASKTAKQYDNRKASTRGGSGKSGKFTPNKTNRRL